MNAYEDLVLNQINLSFLCIMALTFLIFLYFFCIILLGDLTLLSTKYLQRNGCIKFLCTGSVLDFKAGYVKLIHIVYSHVACYVFLSISVIGKEYFEKPHVTHQAKAICMVEDTFAFSI